MFLKVGQKMIIYLKIDQHGLKWTKNGHNLNLKIWYERIFKQKSFQQTSVGVEQICINFCLKPVDGRALTLECRVSRLWIVIDYSSFSEKQTVNFSKQDLCTRMWEECDFLTHNMSYRCGRRWQNVWSKRCIKIREKP